MVLNTGAASPSVTLFPCAFSGPSPFVSEVPDQPKVSSPPLEENITNAPENPMVLVLSPRPLWAPLPAFSLNYEQAGAAARSLLHSGTVAMHSIPGLRPGYASEDLYSFLLDFGLPPALMESMGTIGVLVNQFIQPALVHHQIALGVNSLPPLALDCSIFPRCTKKGSKMPAKPLNFLNNLAHTVDERFVLAYPAEPLPLVAPSWEETLVNLDYLLAWYHPLLKTIRADQSEATTLALSNTSEF
ncbi:hypothetical protein DSO57_1030100 [Entomophthora muscae]|uniref:Uncharacterized protein n=1 Tax=Entomophthora muscae TaxID=34485 RepID=A0ACC2TZJ1_9FUNG|nr:hypothetical protein DSO57_1030100 [Entomophthora muscae]